MSIMEPTTQVRVARYDSADDMLDAMAGRLRQSERKFDRMVELERTVSEEKAMEAFGADLGVRARAYDNRQRAQAELYGFVDGLTPTERDEYGLFRQRYLDN